MNNDYDKYFPPKNSSKIYIPQKIYIAQEEPMYGERLGETKPNSRCTWSDTTR